MSSIGAHTHEAHLVKAAQSINFLESTELSLQTEGIRNTERNKAISHLKRRRKAIHGRCV